MEQYNAALRVLNPTELRMVLFTLLRMLAREDWSSWTAQQAQGWLEAQIRERQRYNDTQVTAIALLAMKLHAAYN